MNTTAGSGNEGNQIPTTEVREKNPLTVLREVFGYESFWPGQEEGVDTVLTNNDAVILIPTGGGKQSFIPYQHYYC